MTAKTALSYWFPRLEAAGLPVPRTAIIPMPTAAQESIRAAFDGVDKNSAELLTFYDNLRSAAAAVGYPCFLRTDHTSGKHFWNETCYLKFTNDVPRNVYMLAEFSEIADFIGLPWSTWVVREFLPTIQLGTCPHYRDMPVCREFRFFVDGPDVACHHPYWPREALEQGGCSDVDYDALCRLDDQSDLLRLASAAGKAVGGGAWSVDILETRRGWFVIDMAEAHKSFHWPGCKNER